MASGGGATFYSYENIGTLTAKNQGTGECLGGRYFWGSDMLLIEEISRSSIEPVIADMLAEGTFERAFQYLGKAEALEPEGDTGVHGRT
ncbi:hypothetical protein ACN28E_33360 [Archangium lansingense]|uniref:hypothetical protein n=1 Tax=Archangium lansingense TaxID=2995310 RepID=UPI003B78B0B7